MEGSFADCAAGRRRSTLNNVMSAALPASDSGPHRALFISAEASHAIPPALWADFTSARPNEMRSASGP